MRSICIFYKILRILQILRILRILWILGILGIRMKWAMFKLYPIRKMITAAAFLSVLHFTANYLSLAMLSH